MEKEIAALEKKLELPLEKKEFQRLELMLNNLSFELKKQNQSREWFDKKNLSALKTTGKKPLKVFKHSWAPEKQINSKTVTIQGASLVQKYISEGNVEKANHALGKLIFDQEIKPNLDIVAAGIEFDHISFIAEEGW